MGYSHKCTQFTFVTYRKEHYLSTLGNGKVHFLVFEAVTEESRFFVENEELNMDSQWQRANPSGCLVTYDQTEGERWFEKGFIVYINVNRCGFCGGPTPCLRED